jgi:hypothetical protein
MIGRRLYAMATLAVAICLMFVTEKYLRRNDDLLAEDVTRRETGFYGYGAQNHDRRLGRLLRSTNITEYLGTGNSNNLLLSQEDRFLSLRTYWALVRRPLARGHIVRLTFLFCSTCHHS